MAIFGSARDMSLFRSVNKEMLRKYIDTEVLFYKLNLDATSTNIYDESDKKVYTAPKLIYSIVTLEEQVWGGDDYGMELTQNATFGFLRDDLIENDLLPQIGDVLEYKSGFYEIDSFKENQFVAGKDPDSWFGGNSHGYNVSIICDAHLTRQSKLNIVQTRFGNSVASNKNTILPNNI
jgi:hypothetical protein